MRKRRVQIDRDDQRIDQRIDQRMGRRYPVEAGQVGDAAETLAA